LRWRSRLRSFERAARRLGRRLGAAVKRLADSSRFVVARRPNPTGALPGDQKRRESGQLPFRPCKSQPSFTGRPALSSLFRCAALLWALALASPLMRATQGFSGFRSRAQAQSELIIQSGVGFSVAVCCYLAVEQRVEGLAGGSRLNGVLEKDLTRAHRLVVQALVGFIVRFQSGTSQ